MEKKKRIRSENYKENETCLLVEKAAKYKDIIENKETDAVSWQQKTETWQKICQEFNASSDTYRDAKSLRLKYDCIKRNIKAKNNNNKYEVYKTGGGTANIQPFKPYEQDLIEIMPPIEGEPYGRDSNEKTENITYENLMNKEDTEYHFLMENINADNPVLNKDCASQENIEIMANPKNINAKDNSKKIYYAVPERKRKRKLRENNPLALNYEAISQDRKKLLDIQIQNAEIENKILKKKEEDLDDELNFRKNERKLILQKLKLELMNCGGSVD